MIVALCLVPFAHANAAAVAAGLVGLAVISLLVGWGLDTTAYSMSEADLDAWINDELSAYALTAGSDVGTLFPSSDVSLNSDNQIIVSGSMVSNSIDFFNWLLSDKSISAGGSSVQVYYESANFNGYSLAPVDGSTFAFYANKNTTPIYRRIVTISGYCLAYMSVSLVAGDSSTNHGQLYLISPLDSTPVVTVVDGNGTSKTPPSWFSGLNGSEYQYAYVSPYVPDNTTVDPAIAALPVYDVSGADMIRGVTSEGVSYGCSLTLTPDSAFSVPDSTGLPSNPYISIDLGISPALTSDQAVSAGYTQVADNTINPSLDLDSVSVPDSNTQILEDTNSIVQSQQGILTQVTSIGTGVQGILQAIGSFFAIDGPLIGRFSDWLASAKNFTLGIWHYVVTWVLSLGAGLSWLQTCWSLIPYSMVVPVYACIVICIVLGLWRRFFG